jgi:hypothetical protein
VWRWTRAGVLAVLTVLISLGGHALAGGSVHLSLPLLLGGAALGALCVAAADVRRSFGEILAVVLTAQPVLHLLASMGHGAHAATSPVSAGMVLGHVGAALVVSVLLADAERAWWSLAGLLAPRRLPRTIPLTVDAPTPVVMADRSPAPLYCAGLSMSVRGRAPPVVASAH